LILSVVAFLGMSRSALAQNYLLPDAPGRAVVLERCEVCHGPVLILHKRSPNQWNEVVGQMITQGANVTDGDRKVILAYLDKYFGQAKDYVPRPAPLRAPGPGLTLALQAAEGAEQFCENEGHQVTVLVADSGGNTIVLLTGNRLPLVTQADAASKAATVLRFKESSGAVMKRMETDPALVAETRDDPEIGEVLQGGLPITVRGEIIGAIAVSGAFGPSVADEVCARAGLKRIQAGLQRLASRLP
jgi:uncharacterized protein GlcG (DUF336 family)